MVLSKQLQTLPSFADVERKLIEFFRKHSACFSKQESACPDQRFQGKQINYIFSVHLFRTLSGNSIDSGEKFWALLSKLHSTCPEVPFRELFWDKIERFLKCCIFSSRKIPEGLSELLFTTSQEYFGAKTCLSLTTKTFLSVSDFELKLLGLLPRKVLPVLSKQHYAFREQHFEAKWCFWKEYIVMLFMFSER